jgi:hypothetical protein
MRLPRTFQVLAMTEWEKGFILYIGIWVTHQQLHKLQMKYSYFAYGLLIRSALPLPELVIGEGVEDVVVRFDKLDLSLLKTTFEGTDFRVTTDGVFFFWENEGKFLVRGGKEIIIDPAPGVDERVLRLFILGPALAVVLQQRGLLVLHAATVEIGGAAVAIMGAPGCGKSTLAATLYRWDHGIVADDITAIQSNGGEGAVVFPGFPQLKLWPEVVTSLGDDPEKLPCLEPGIEKRAKRTTHRFSLKPIPLRRIYVLAECQPHKIEPLTTQEAFIELIRHSCLIQILQKIIRPSLHFSQCGSIANHVSISRLNRPCSLSSLPDVVRMVEEDLAHC